MLPRVKKGQSVVEEVIRLLFQDAMHKRVVTFSFPKELIITEVHTKSQSNFQDYINLPVQWRITISITYAFLPIPFTTLTSQEKWNNEESHLRDE